MTAPDVDALAAALSNVDSLVPGIPTPEDYADAAAIIAVLAASGWRITSDERCPAVIGEPPHAYEIKCKACGQLGQVRVSVVGR